MNHLLLTLFSLESSSQRLWHDTWNSILSIGAAYGPGSGVSTLSAFE